MRARFLVVALIACRASAQPVGFLSGANTFEHSHSSTTIATVVGQLTDAKIGWAREWIYWPYLEPQPGSYNWSGAAASVNYDLALERFRQGGIRVHAVIAQTPPWASCFRDVKRLERDPLGQGSYVPPCREVAKEPVSLSGETPSPLGVRAPLDGYAIVASSQSLVVYAPATNWSQPTTTGDYVVDYETASIQFSRPGTYYLSYLDAFGRRYANVQTVVASAGQRLALENGGRNPRYSGLLADGTVNVTAEPTYVEGSDFTIAYSIQATIRRLPGSAIPDGATVYVTYDVLDAGPGSAWNRFLTAFASRYADRVDAIAPWNEPSGDGLAFWGAKHNAETYAEFLHLSAQAIRAAAPRMKIVDGWDAGSTDRDEQLYAVQQREHWEADADIHSVHMYPPTPDGIFATLRSMHAIAEAHGVAERPVWLTEIGWMTGPGGVDDAAAGYVSFEHQADYLVRTLAQASSRPEVGGLFWFAHVGYPPPNWGLVSVVAGRLVPKPAYQAFSTFNRWVDGLTAAGTIAWQENAGTGVDQFVDPGRWQPPAGGGSVTAESGALRIDYQLPISTPSLLLYQLDLTLPAIPVPAPSTLLRVDVVGDGSNNLFCFLVRARNGRFYLTMPFQLEAGQQTAELTIVARCAVDPSTIAAGCDMSAPPLDQPIALSHAALLRLPEGPYTGQLRLSGARVYTGPLGFDYRSADRRVRVIWGQQTSDASPYRASLSVPPIGAGGVRLLDRGGTDLPLTVENGVASFGFGAQPLYLVEGSGDPPPASHPGGCQCALGPPAAHGALAVAALVLVVIALRGRARRPG